MISNFSNTKFQTIGLPVVTGLWIKVILKWLREAEADFLATGISLRGIILASHYIGAAVKKRAFFSFA
jgi:hypothetical protein